MLKRFYLLFLLVIGLSAGQIVYGQCSQLTGATPFESFNASPACAPVVANWTITYEFFSFQTDTTRWAIEFRWNDPANTVTLVNPTWNAGYTEATASASVTYPAGGNCSYQPRVLVRYDLNDDGIFFGGAENCVSSFVQKTVGAWSDDNSNSGILAINPVNQQVCYEDSTLGFQFQDATFPNCEISIEPDRPNQQSRWVQFIYGTGGGPHIPNVTIDTGGGTVQLTDAAGNLTAAAPFLGPVIYINAPVTQADLNELTYPITHPDAGFPNIGDVFEITLKNWNICNRYDNTGPNFLNPADLVNGDNPPITTTAQLEIIGPTVPTAGPDQGICGNSTNLAGNVIGTGTGQWNQLTGTVGGVNITNANNPTTAVNVVGTNYGTYTFEWSSTLGTCASGRDTVEIIFYQPPSASNAGTNQNICGSSTNLAANNPAVGTGQWFYVGGAGGQTISNSLNRNSAFTGNFGTHTLEWRISNGTCPPTTSQVQIVFEETPTIASAGADDTTICNDLTYVLQGNNITVGTGTWSKISGPGGALAFAPNANDPNATVTFPTYGVFRLRWRSSTGTGICPNNADFVDITAFQTPTTATTGGPINLCGLTTTLNGNNATVGLGTWSQVSGPGTSLFVNANNPTTNVTVSIDGTYVFRWTIRNGNCPPTTADVSVQFDPPPTTPLAGPDDSICNTLTYVLNGNPITNGTGTWIQNSGPAIVGFTPNANDENATVTFSTQGVHEFIWESDLPPACPILRDTVIIRVFSFPSPAAIVTADPTSTCNLTGIPISAVAPAIGFGQWYQLSGPGTLTIGDSVNNNTTVSAPVSGTYEVLWEVTNGNCSPPQRDTLTLILESPSPSIAGNDTSVCAAFDTLNANTPSVGTGAWSVIAQPGGGTFTFDDPNKPNARFDLTNGVFGNYTLEWRISNGGCTDEVDTVIITLDQDPTPANVIGDFQICADTAQLGATPVTVGSGQWQLISGTGPATYNPNSNDPNAVVSVPPISDTEVYQFEWTTSNGVCLDTKDTLQVTFFEISTTPNAGAPFEVCNTSTSMSANPITVGTGAWSQVAGPSILTISTPASPTTNVNIGAFVNDSDTFLLEWSSVNGNCVTLRDTVQVIFHDDPTNSAAGTDISICADTALLNANTPTVGLGTWSQVSGTGSVSFDNNNDPNTIVRAPIFAGDSGVYILRWRITNGNCAPSNNNVRVVFYKDPTVATAGSDDSVCALTYTLDGNFDVIGLGDWNQITGPGTSSFVDQNDFNTDVTVTQYGTYTFEWNISNGPCQTTRDTVQIRFDEFPSSALAGVDDTVCDVTTTLAGNNPAVGTGVWTVTSSPSGTAVATFVDSSLFNTGVTVNEVGAYTFQWTISNGTCADSSDQVIIIFASSNSNTGIVGDTTLCVNVSNQVYTVPFVAGTTYEWFIPAGITTQFGGGINDNFIVLTYPNAGTFELKVLPTNSFGCASDTQTTSVTVYDFPGRDAGPDWAICSGDTAFLGGAPTATGGSGFYNYSWSPTSGLDDASIANPIATPIFSRTYFLTVTDSIAGCTSVIDTVNVTVNPSPSSNLLGLTPFICEEDTGILQIFFNTGTGPYSVGISNGVDTTIYPSLTTGDSILVTPDSTLTYQVVYLFDSATLCTGTSFSGAPIINVRPLPNAVLTSLDTVICEGDAANLNLTVSGPTPQIYTVEYAINGLDTTTVNLSGSSTVITVNPDSSSLYTLISVTDNFRGCRVDAPSVRFTDSVFIQVDSLPRANLVGGDTICVGDSAALVVNLTSGAGPYNLTVQGLGNVTNYNSGDTIWVFPTTTTNYIITQVSDTNGCTTTAGSLITGNALIRVNPLPVANLIGANTICLGDSTALQVNVSTGTNPFVVVLSNGDTINPYNNGDQHFVSPTVTTTYSLVSVLDTNGCYTSAPSSSLTGTPQITVNPLPTAQIASDDTICFDDNVVLTFSFTGAAPYTFTFRDNTRNVDSTLTTSGALTTRNVTVSPDTTTLYSIVSVQDANGCIDSINNPINPTFGDTVEIVVDSLPVATIVADLPTDTICNGDQAYLYVNVTTGPGPYDITINNGVGTITGYVSGDSIPVSPSVTTGYVITSLLDQNGCSVSAGHPNIDDTATIVVNPLPVANLTGTATICLGDTTPLNVAIAPGTNPFTVVINDGTLNDTITNYVSGTNIPVAPIVTTTYSLVSVLDSFGCYTNIPSANLTGTPQVTVNPLPTAQITQDDTICFGDNITLSFSFTGTAPFIAIYKDNTTGINDTVTTTGLSTSATTVVSPDTTTLYSLVSVQGANGCIDSINNPINPTFGDTVEIVVDSLPVATIVADLPTDTICNGDQAYLYVNVTTGPGPYDITINNGVGTITGYVSGDSIPVSPSVTTGYVITSLLDQNGCSVSAGHPNIDDTATIVVNPLPVANLTGTATICLGDTTPLNVAIAPGTNPFTVVINDGTLNDTITNYVSGTNIPVAPIVTTTYSLVSVLDSFGCYTNIPSANLTGTPQVTVNPLPTAQITQDDTICFGDNITLSFSFTGTAPFIAIYKDNTTGINDTVTTTGLSTSATTVVSPDTTTLYSLVSVQGANGCIDSINNPINPTFGDTVEIVVDSLPVATIVADLPTDTICNGDQAYLYVNVTTGPGPYDITINNGVGTITGYVSGDSIPVSPSVTTGYVITSLLDQNGCSVSAGHPNIDDTATIVVNPLPVANLTGTATICLGDTTPLNVAIAPGTNPFTVVINDGTLNDTITNYVSGTNIPVAPIVTTTYSLVSVLDSFGCYTNIPSANLTGTPQVTVNPLPTAQITQDDTICFGDNITLSFSFTGTAPFIAIYKDNTTGINDTVTTTGLSTSATTVVSPDTTTLYSLVSVQGANGCIDSINNPINPTFGDTVEIVVDSLPVATIVADLPTDTICNGDQAYLYVNVTTGPGPYDITINNGVGTITGYVSGDSIPVSPSVTTGYVITSLLDQNGCSVSAGHPNIDDTATIVVNPLPNVTLSIDTNRICFGDSTNLRVALNVGTSPLEFVISPNLTDTITNFNPLTDSIIVSPNATTTYSIVYVTDANGCSVTAPSANINGSPQLNINPLPTAQVASDDTICFGDDVVLNFSFTGSTPFTFTFRDNTRNVDSTLSTVSNLTSRNVTVSPDSTTLYSIVSVQDGQGCIDSVNNAPISPNFGDTVEIVVDSLPVATIVADLPTDTICNGDVAYLFVNITTGPGPYDITINNGIGTINNYISGDSIAVNPTTIGANNYVITGLLDQNGCSVSAGHPNIDDTATIVVNPLPNVTLSIDTNRICFGDTTNLRVALNVGTSPLEFVISPNVNDTITNFDPLTDFVPVSPNATTTYSINYVIDANGCQVTAPSANINGSPQLNINPLPTLQISDSTTICLEDQVVLTFSMSGSAPYTFTYRDELTGTDSTITTVGGLTTRTVTEFPLDTTMYTLVSITDAQGCTDSINNAPINPNFGDTIVVNVNPLPITTLTVVEPTDTICFGDNALFIVDITNLGDAPGPYNLEISGGIGVINNYTSGDTIIFAPNTTNNYNIVSLTDANGCSVLAGHPNLPDTVQVVVTPLPVVELLLDDNEICLGDSARLYWRVPVGSPRFDFVLNTDPTDTIKSVSVGDSLWVSPTDTTTYSIIYFSDSFGCTVTAPSSNISGTPTLIVNPIPDASISINKDTVCFGETTTITFSLTGPNDPYTYQIDTTGNILSGFNVIDGTTLSYVLGVGDHDFKLIEVIDDKGCVANIAPADSLVEVFVHALPTASISGDTSVCDLDPFVLNFNLSGNGPLNVYFNDGTNNYLRQLNTPTDTALLSLPASVNPYFFSIDSVVDANTPESCRATDITGLVTVQVFDRPEIEINSFDTTICEGDQAILTFDINGGRAPFEVDLSIDGTTLFTTLTNIADGSIFIVNPLDTTTYTILEIRESLTTEACVGTIGTKSSFTVNVNPLPTANLTLVGPDTKCFGDSITVNIQFTGQAPYNLSLLTNYAGPLSLNGIQTNDTTFNVSSSFPGFGNTISLFTLSDGHTPTCSVIQGDPQLTGTVTFNLNDIPSASLNPQGLTSICRGDSADLLVVVSQGDLPYTVYISDGSTNYVDSLIITSGNTGTIAVSPQNTSTFQIDSVVDGSLPLSCRAENISGSVQITVNDRPTVGISGIDTICAFENSSFQIQANGTGPWLVTYSNGIDTLPTFISTSPATVSLFNPPVGLNVYSIVSITDNGTVPGCPADSLTNDSAYIFVNDLPTASISGDTTICDGEPLPVYLDFGVTNGPFEVTITDGTNNYNFTGLAQQDTVLIPYPGDGFYIYRFTAVSDANTNCEPLVSTGQALVQVRPIPTATLSVVGNTVICGADTTGKFLQFNFDEPNVYDVILQRDGIDVDTLLGIGNGTILQAPGLQVGNNSYTIVSAEYSSVPKCALNIVNNADIFVNADPTVTILQDDTICVGSSVTLTFNVTGAPTYSVNYLSSTGVQNITSTNSTFTTTVSPTITTSYRLLNITDGNGCSTNNILPSDSTEAIVTVNALPTAALKVEGFFSSNVTFCEEDTVALQLQLTGNGPFDVVIGNSIGAPNIIRNGVNNLDTILLLNPPPPIGSTTYFLSQVTDNNNPACAPTTLGNPVNITVQPLPIASISGDTTICDGNTAELTFTFTGTGPWTFRYFDGVLTSALQTSTTNTFTVNVFPNATTTYTIFDVVDQGTTNQCGVDANHPNVTGSAVVTVEPAVNADFTFLSDQVCGVPTVSFTDQTTPAQAYTYLWDFGDTATTSNLQNPTHQYSNFTLFPIDYSVKLRTTSSIGCVDSVVKTVRVLPDITADVTTDTTEGCTPLDITFTSNINASGYQWDFENNGTQLLPNNSSVTHTFSNTGLTSIVYNVYHVALNQYGCSDTLIIPITVNPLPQPVFNANPVTQNWPPSPVTFTNGTPNLNSNTYLWSFGDAANGTSTNVSPTYDFGTYGNFTVTLTATTPNGCKDSTTRLVTIFPSLPVASFEGSTTGCVPFEMTFNNTSEFGLSYRWEFSDGSTYFSEDVTKTFFDPGTYDVKLVAIGFDGFEDSVERFSVVTGYPNPSANFFSRDSVFVGLNEINFSNESRNASDYFWDFGDGTTSEERSPTKNYRFEGQYEVTMVAINTINDSIACRDTANKIIYVLPVGDIIVPNAFTPGEGGPTGGSVNPFDRFNNTVFYPVIRKEFVALKFEVFNRWGEPIFQSNTVNVGWDGYVNGNPAPQGVYIYRVQVEFADGTKETKVGDVTLLR